MEGSEALQIHHGSRQFIATCSRRVGKPPIKVVKSKGILPQNGRDIQGKVRFRICIVQTDPTMVKQKIHLLFL